MPSGEARPARLRGWRPRATVGSSQLAGSTSRWRSASRAPPPGCRPELVRLASVVSAGPSRRSARSAASGSRTGGVRCGGWGDGAAEGAGLVLTRRQRDSRRGFRCHLSPVEQAMGPHSRSAVMLSGLARWFRVEVTSHTRAALYLRSCECDGRQLCIGHCPRATPAQVLNLWR